MLYATFKTQERDGSRSRSGYAGQGVVCTQLLHEECFRAQRRMNDTYHWHENVDGITKACYDKHTMRMYGGA